MNRYRTLTVPRGGDGMEKTTQTAVKALNPHLPQSQRSGLNRRPLVTQSASCCSEPQRSIGESAHNARAHGDVSGENRTATVPITSPFPVKHRPLCLRLGGGVSWGGR